ncbi:hypothetical protein SAMN05661080_05197 [Modestobacter sp. DSM 44400]|uniref:hypothetical protein n=1 Tax=Modestobacter sp. DSM 44400 TaxID=1550230 RepID=UPI00089425A1|nr:hypothetical protein [Modestobacter sp. DSM 44400]SDY98361.1 hypothetical protein SAMN05661080_05197 [Modestobacter sp. DSM 44400]
MPADLGADKAVERARRLLDPRFDSIRTLADCRAALTDARRALEQAETADAQAYAAATRAGWSQADLKAVGFDAPTRRLPGRPRTSRPASAGTGANGTPSAAAAEQTQDPA